jgi:hypothetical protein
MYQMAKTVVYSHHARQRMVLRGISSAEVELALTLGAKSRQGNRVVAAYRYFEVVYVVRGPRIFIVTVKPRW